MNKHSCPSVDSAVTPRPRTHAARRTIMWASGTVRAVLASLALAAAASASACEGDLVLPLSSFGKAVGAWVSPPSGAFMETLRRGVAASGCQLRFVPVPRARAEHMMFVTGQADILAPAVATARYRPPAFFVRLGSDQLSVVTRRDDQVALDSLEQLGTHAHMRGVRVRGYAFGDQYEAFMAELQHQGRLDTVADWRTAFAMLSARRAQFMVLPTASVAGLLRQELNDPGLALASCVLTDAQPIHYGYFLSSRVGPDVRAALANVIGKDVQNIARRQALAAAQAPAGACVPAVKVRS